MIDTLLSIAVFLGITALPLAMIFLPMSRPWDRDFSDEPDDTKDGAV